MLWKRVLTAVILLPLVGCAIFLLPTRYFELLTALFLVFTAREWSILCGANKVWIQLLYCLAIVGALYAGIFFPLLAIYGMALAWWLLAALWLYRYPKGSALWNDYAGLRYLLGFLVLVPCWFAVNQVRKSVDGEWHLLLLFIIVWLTDIGAYFVGRFFGQKKLLPAVSPNKTREGFYGGLICAFIASVIYAWFFDAEIFASPLFVILVIMTALFSVVGDLTESMAKRLSGVKDSGTWLPGHGGLLDRIDSLLAAAPIFALILWTQS